MEFKKRFLFVILVVLCGSLFLSSCNNEGGNGAETASPSNNVTTASPTVKPTIEPTPTPEPTEAPTEDPVGTKSTLKGMDGYAFTAKSETSFILDKLAGNNHVISSTHVEAFILEADITWLDGNIASFMFGAISNFVEEFETLYGVELKKDDSGNLYIKMFQDSSPGYTSLGDGIIPVDTLAATGVDINKPAKLVLEVTADKEIKISVNGDPVEFTMKEDVDFKGDYKGGYLGVLTWESEAQYDNVYYTNLGSFN